MFVWIALVLELKYAIAVSGMQQPYIERVFVYLLVFVCLFVCLFIYLFIYQEPTDIPSRKKNVPDVGVSEDGVCCKIIFL